MGKCRMPGKWHFRFFLLGGIFLCVLIMTASLCLGSLCFSPLELVRILAGGGERVAKNILVYARFPRTFAALASGAALSVSGAVLQNVLDNKLASPGIIGVNAGAGLGVTLCIAAGTFSGFAVSCAAFFGSFITVFMIFLFSYRVKVSKSTVKMCIRDRSSSAFWLSPIVVPSEVAPPSVISPAAPPFPHPAITPHASATDNNKINLLLTGRTTLHFFLKYRRFIDCTAKKLFLHI